MAHSLQNTFAKKFQSLRQIILAVPVLLKEFKKSIKSWIPKVTRYLETKYLILYKYFPIMDDVKKYGTRSLKKVSWWTIKLRC